MLARMVEPGATVLELGVATGYLTQYLTEAKGCQVDGVEIDPRMAREARRFCRDLLVGDLDQLDLLQHFGDRRYDFIVCADVLEHLKHPERVLSQLTQLLALEGRLLVSIPNVAYAGVLMALLHGDFPYRFEGLLDETHLRFFTRRTFDTLLERVGARILSVDPVVLPLERSEFRDYSANTDSALRERFLTLPDAQTYQFIYAADCLERRDQPRTAEPVDVIVPVFGALPETERCLASVLSHPQRTPFELVVVDDASPEPGIKNLLRGLAAEGKITLIENRQNLGFTQSANLGMSLHPSRDVVLLNSDTEVHGDWLDRLVRCAHASRDVGTVTPFTNNGTICGYPLFFRPNPLPQDADLAALDELFRELNAGQSVEIPTAVGFCMYIRRTCLHLTGLFDAETFGRGYGEEVDFCMKASNLGFRHLLCADLFVYHKGETSFAADASPLKRRARATIDARYPAYGSLVGAHAEQDPARPLRRRVDIARLSRSGKPVLVMVTHFGGGGTEEHLRTLANLLSDRFSVLILRPVEGDLTKLEWARAGEEFSAYFRLSQGQEELIAFLRAIGVARVHYHHLLGLGPQVLGLARDLGVPYDFTVHDYYPVCPQYQLVTVDGSYCGEPDESGCRRCLEVRPSPWGVGIVPWRQMFKNFLAEAERVIAPSQDVASRIDRYLGLGNVVVWSHPEVPAPPPIRPCRPADGPVKVLALGRLTPAKGIRVLEACASDAAARRLPLFFRLLGYATEPVRVWPDLPLSVSGEYRSEDLGRLIELEPADVIVFPALWPETYCFTLSTAIASGLPIIAPDLGAFAERLASYPNALILSWQSSAADWNDAILRLVGPAAIPVEA
jgi:GT2 family glycosyltransferase/SAM-dependent methyltransferase/glycosyltransferase involved in cell wall biosynthesis